MQDIVTKLFNQNQVVFLIQVFLSLDIESLKKCFQVCPSWRIFLEEYLLYSSFNHTKIIHKAWLQFKPAHEKVITHGDYLCRFDAGIIRTKSQRYAPSKAGCIKEKGGR